MAGTLSAVMDWLGRTNIEVDRVNSGFIYSSCTSVITKEGEDNISCEPDSNRFVRESRASLNLNEMRGQVEVDRSSPSSKGNRDVELEENGFIKVG